ncbi:MAG: hypothetical protein K2G26_03570, partial [Clostridia bacterium]|nr:hypothetical protein [Clostridia bacterium]
VSLLSNKYEWNDSATNASQDRTFTFRVNKKPLSINWTTDSDGNKVAQFADINEIYSRDSGTKYPQLVTKYYEDGDSPNNLKDSPTTLGTWVAVAVLENADTCNYKVDATSTFTTTKKMVAYPTVSGSASEIYDGTSQGFIFTGFDADLMDFTVPNGVDGFDGETLYATNVGQYTPVYTLKNTSLYQWNMASSSATVEITPKTVAISANVDGGEWSWERKTTKEVEITVSGVATTDLPNLTINATYSKDGVSKTTIGTVAYVSGSKFKITIPSIAQIATYTLTLTLADGGNYALATPFTQTFNITGTVPPFDEQYIVWQYVVDGKKTQLNDFVYDGDVVLVEYTGKEYTFSVDENDLQIYGLKVKTNGYDGQSATNVKTTDNGIYTLTVAIGAIDENTVFDDVFTLQFKIVPKVLDFSNTVWQWQYADGGEEWKPLTDGSMPSFDNKAVAVRVSPDYMLSLGLAANDYGITYSHNGNLTEKGDKASTATITITNGNYVTDEGGDYIEISKDWKITAKSLSYSWDEKGQTVAGPDDRSFEIPAIVFADGNDYSDYYEYYFTVDDVDGEMTREELEAYLTANWSDTTTVRGRVYVRMKTDASDEFAINSGYRSFTTGTPKTSLGVAVTGSGAEYGKVDFAISVLRGTADESRRTSVTVSGGALTEAQTFDGDDTELVKFINKLGAGSYTVTVSLKTGNEDSYVLSRREFGFEILKCSVQVPTVREIVFTGETINLIDYLEGFDPALMKLIGAAEGENGIVSGRDYRKSGYFTTIALIDGANYQFVKAAESEAESVKATLKFAVAFADGEEVLGSEYEINLMINSFRITED